ncbi:S41 family peptidase [Chitinophaga caseinilytica]|uniref:S41 family peptidase n=1 Tax=Chitinophaga caseinilytica TaxID=2267521 RepID=A0ABZ2Z4W0_9BACT
MLRTSLFLTLFLFSCVTAMAQTARQAINQYTFARLYGYVRFFHPSDAGVVTDWDALAIYGAQAVDGAKNAAELKSALEGIFHPIAPTLRIYETGKPALGPLEAPRDAGRMKVVMWQHSGYGPGGGIYKSIRTNSYNFLPKATGLQGGGFTNITTQLDAKPYRGRKFRFTAASLATNLRDAYGQFWVRVDRVGDGIGFFDNMDNRRIMGVSQKWRRDTIAGTVDPDAESINFGAFVIREGDFLIDDLRLEVEMPEGWKTLDFNGNFENDKPGKDPSGWSYDENDKSIILAVESGSPPEGKQALRIGRAGEPIKAEYASQLFPIDLAAGTFLHKDLGNGLTIDMPMALWGDGKTTFPATDTIAARALSQQRAAGLSAPLTGENLYLRLANVCITWNIYQHFHPYFKEWTTNWDQDLQTAIADCYRDKTPAGFERTLARLNARLHDGHTYVAGPQTFVDRRFLPLQLAWADNSLVVTAVFSPDTKAKRGNVITAINGIPTQEYLKQRSAFVSAGSANAMMRQTIGSLCVSKPDSSLQLTFRSGNGQTWREKVPFSIPANEYYGKLPNTRPAAFDSLGSGIVYIDLSRLGWNEMKEKLDEIAAAKGVVVDLRGYPKDENGSQIIGHLITKKDKDKWMHTQRITRPDHENTGWDSFGWNLTPKKPHIAGKTVFLTDGSAISYAESVMGYIKDQQLATIIGEPTAGANGNVTGVNLPGGYTFRYTGMKVTQHNGAQHFTKGIEPDILVKPTIKGIIDNKDELLEKAVDVIKNGQATVKNGREAK